jgi:hypothetical protein
VECLRAVHAQPFAHVHDEPPVADQLPDGLGADGEVLLEVRSAEGLGHVARQAVDLLAAAHEHERAVATQPVVQDRRRDVDAQHLVRPDNWHLRRGRHRRDLVPGSAQRLGPRAADEHHRRRAHRRLEQLQPLPLHPHPAAAGQHRRRRALRDTRAQKMREPVLLRSPVEVVHGDGQVHRDTLYDSRNLYLMWWSDCSLIPCLSFNCVLHFCYNSVSSR